MSAPISYTPAVDFSEEETEQTSGRSTLRTPALDQELSSIKSSIDSLITRSTAIQRDDNQMLDGVVHYWALASDVLSLISSAGWNIRGAWLTATAYAVRDFVTQGTGTYVCMVAHTSGTFAADLAAGRWGVVFDSATLTASNISFTPTGTISAANVQTAIAEVASEAAQKSSNLSDLANAVTARTNLSVASRLDIQRAYYSGVALTGTADALLGTSSLTVANLADSNFTIWAYAIGANTVAAPTLNLDGLGAKTIKKLNAQPLVAGDIAGAGHVLQLYWSVGDDCFLLLNPTFTGTETLLSTLRLPKSFAPNPFFQIDQRVNAATSRANDTYCLDRWYVLTQSNPVTVTAQTVQENGQASNIRITQSNAAAQRFGAATVLHSYDCLHLRGQTVTFRPRVRVSSSQAVRIAVLEWSGSQDNVTSDVVNAWTNGTFTAGQFFKSTTQAVSGVGVKTPSAATWTDMDGLTVTLGTAFTNLILFVWVEQTAAQNVTLDIGKVRFALGTYVGDIEVPVLADELARCQRFYEKSFGLGTQPASGGGSTISAFGFRQIPGASVATSIYVPYKVRKFTPGGPVTFYNPIVANAQCRNTTVNADCTVTTAVGEIYEHGFMLNLTTAVGSAANNANFVHWEATHEL